MAIGQESGMRLARLSFGIAGVYGLLLTVPAFFAGLLTAPDDVWKNAFTGAAAATQLLYFVIARDPLRPRALIPIGILSKLTFVAAVVACRPPDNGIPRWSYGTLWFAAIDLALAALFALNWWRLRRS